jgi:hypothetical protein
MCGNELEPHGIMPQKTFAIVTAEKTSQEVAFFGRTYYPSMGRLINNYSTVIQLWTPITLKMEVICSP